MIENVPRPFLKSYVPHTKERKATSLPRVRSASDIQKDIKKIVSELSRCSFMGIPFYCTFCHFLYYWLCKSNITRIVWLWYQTDFQVRKPDTFWVLVKYNTWLALPNVLNKPILYLWVQYCFEEIISGHGWNSSLSVRCSDLSIMSVTESWIFLLFMCNPRICYPTLLLCIWLAWSLLPTINLFFYSDRNYIYI